MEHNWTKKLRSLLSLILVVAMLMPSVAFAAPGMLVLPPFVTAIEEQAFQRDTSLTNVVIPDETVSIGAEAFEGCTGLESVTIPDSVVSIGKDAFANCGSVVIRCSQGSYAAQYALANNLTVQYVGELIEASFEQMIDTVYIGGGEDYLIGAAEIVDYDPEKHGDVVWTLTCEDDEAAVPVKMYVDENPEEGYAHIRFNELGEMTGEANYRLKVECGTFTDSFIYTLNVAEMPEDMPTGFSFIGDTHFEMGETLSLTPECVEFNDGAFDVMDDNVRFVLPDLENTCIWKDNEGVWIEDGAEITFAVENGRYWLPVCLLIGNVEYYWEFTIAVGNGVPADAELTFANGGNGAELYLLDEMEELCWLDSAWMANYPYDSTLPAQWSKELLSSSNDEPLMDLMLETDSYSGEVWAAELLGTNLSGETGTDTWRVSLTIGENTYSQEYTITVDEQPENLPTALTGVETEVQLEIGEEYTFLIKDIEFADGVVPDGVDPIFYVNNVPWEMEEQDSFQWLYDENDELLGFTFTPQADGRYAFNAAADIRNYYLSESIMLIIGTGIPADAKLVVDRPSDTLILMPYDDFAGTYMGTFHMEGYPVDLERADYWKIDVLECSSDTNVIDAHIEPHGYGHGAELWVDNVSGEEGTIVFRVTYGIDGNEFTCDAEYNTVAWSEELPTDEDLILPEYDYMLQVGDYYEFNESDVTVENLPEGMEFHVGIDRCSDPWPLEQLFGFTWEQDGFSVEFDEEGYYFFRVNADIALNYTLSRYVTINVGEDIFAETELLTGEAPDQIIYLDEDLQDGDMWFNSVYLTGCDIEFDENIDYRWDIEVVESTGEEPVAYIDLNSEWQNTWGTDLWLYGVTGEPGSTTYRVTLRLMGREFSKLITVNALPLPEGMPGDEVMEIETDNRVEVGEKFEFRVDDIVIHEDLIPEGVEGWLEYYWVDGWNPNTMPNFEWLDPNGEEGFAVTFDEEGRVWVRVGYRFAVNYAIEKNVYITAGDGINGEMTLQHSGKRMQNVYTDSDDSWFGWWMFDNYLPMDGEYVDWKLERISGPDDDDALYVDSVENNGTMCHIRVREGLQTIGEEKYCLTVTVGDVAVLSDEFTINIVERDEALPECLTGIENLVELNVEDTFELLFEDYGFDSVPDGAVVRKCFLGLDWSLEWQDGFEWIEAEDGEVLGFRFTPTYNGRYVFYAEAFINNVYYREPVCIMVGNGLFYEDEELKFYYSDDAFFDLYAGEQGPDNWLSEWSVPQIDLYEGEEAQWSIKRVTEGEAEPLIDLYLDGQWPSGLGNNLHYEMLADVGQTGTEKYLLTFDVPGIHIEQELVFNILPLPENLPTEVTGFDTDVHVDVGEEYMFYYADWKFVDGEIPEDAILRVRLGEAFLGENFDLGIVAPEHEGDTSGGIYYVPFEDGNYYMDILFSLNNYTLVQRVNITAGEGMQLRKDHEEAILYVDGTETDGRWHVDSAQLRPGRFDPELEAKWSIRFVESTNGTPVTSVELGDQWDENWGCPLFVTGLTGEVGTDTYEVKLELAGKEYTCLYTIKTIQRPEILPTDEDLVLPGNDYRFEIGDTYEFRFDECVLNNVPEGTELRWGIDGMGEHWPLEEIETFEWLEDNQGFRVTFTEEGRYAFRVWFDLVSNYGVSGIVSIQVGEPTMEGAFIESHQNTEVLFYDYGDAYIGYWQLRDCMLLPSDEVEWVIERAHADFQTEEPIVGVEIVQVWDDNMGVEIEANNPCLTIDGSEQYGSERYILRCIVNGEEIASADIHLIVDELYEDEVVKELWLDNSVYHMDLGDVFEFNRDMFGLNEESGYIPGNVTPIHDFHLPPSIQEYPGFSWTEEGFSLTANEDRAFRFDAAVRLGNYRVTAPVTVIFGTGMSDDYSVEWNDVSFELYQEHGTIWVTDVRISDYVPLSEDGIQWSVDTVEKEDELDNLPVYLRVDRIEEAGTFASFMADQFSDINGSIDWVITAKDGDRVLVERTITLTLSDLPENLPTEEQTWIIWDNANVNLDPGEELTFNEDMFGLTDDAFVPENQIVIKEIHVPDFVRDNTAFEWVEQGFRAVFHTEGRYVFEAVIWIGNYGVRIPVTVTVGSGVHPDFDVHFDRAFDTLYKGYDDAWVVDVHINGYMPPAGTEIEWDCYPKYHPEYVPVEMYLIDTWNDACSAGFHARPNGDENGEVVWVITAKAGDEVLVNEEITLYLEDLPYGLPEAVYAPSNIYTAQVGDRLTFSPDELWLSSGEFSENFIFELWPGETLHSEELHWNEDGGFTVTFNKAGRHVVTAAASFGNYLLTYEIRIVVGGGIPEDLRLYFEQFSEEIYLTEHSEEGYTLAFASVGDYVLFEGEKLTWTVECLTADDGEALEIAVEAEDKDARLVLKGIKETGFERCRLTVINGDVMRMTHDFSVYVVELPENMPTDLTIEDKIDLNPGDVYVFSLEDVDFAGGTVPENAETSSYFEYNDNLNGLGWAGWTDDGLEMHFYVEGRYEFIVKRNINNYVIEKTVLFTIGDGMPAENPVHLEHFVDTLYIGGEEIVVGSIRVLDGLYNRLENEEFTWTIEKTNGNSDVMLVSEPWENGWGAELRAVNLNGEPGYAEFSITVKGDLFEETCIMYLGVEETPDYLPSGLMIEEDEFFVNVGESLHLDWRNGYETTNDGYFPEYAHIEDRYLVDETTFGGEEIIWDDDMMGFTVNFTKDGRYVFQAAKYINNIPLTHDMVVYVGSGMPEGAELKIEPRFTRAFNVVEPDLRHFVADLRIEGYQLANDEEIEWYVEPVEPDANSIFELELEKQDALGASLLLKGVTGETGSMTYRIYAYGKHGVAFTQDFTFEIIEQPDNLPTEMTGVETDVRLNAGDTYTLDVSAIGMNEGEIPEGVEWYLEYFSDMYLLEYLDSFRWNEDGGFTVTFNRDGEYQFRLGYRIGTNYYLVRDITITVGEGADTDAGLHVNELSNVMIVGEDLDRTAQMFEVFLSDYEIAEGEKIEWSIERLDGGEHPPVELFIHEIRDEQTCASLYARVASGEIGVTNFRVHMITESGYRDSVDYAIETIEYSDWLPNDLGLPNVYELNVGEEFAFIPSEEVNLNTEIPGNVKYHFVLNPDEALQNAEGFDWRFNGTNGTHDHFYFTPVEEGRYNVNVKIYVGNYFREKNVQLIVGDGIADDVAVAWEQYVHTAYTGLGEGYLLGYAVLENYNLMPGEGVQWSFGRIDENDGYAAEIWIDASEIEAEIRYGEIRETGSVTYRVTVNTDGGYTESREFTLTIKDQPENLPTEISFDIPMHYEVGETMTFLPSSISFADGVLPQEDNNLRVVVPGLDSYPIWYENEAEWLDGGCAITFKQDGRYAFPVTVMIGNYLIEREYIITVGTGVPQELRLKCNHVYRELFWDMDEDGWIGDVYLENYPLMDGEEVEWTVEMVDSPEEYPLYNLYVNNTFDGGRGANLHANNIVNHVEDWTTWRVTAKVNDLSASADFAMVVLSPYGLYWPDEHDVQLKQTDLHLEVGETFTFYPWQIGFDVGMMEGRICERELWLSPEIEPYTRWIEDGGIEVSFDKEGRFSFEAAVRFGGNWAVSREIRITVGDGLTGEENITFDQRNHTYFMQQSSMPVGSAYLHNYTKFGRELIHWYVEAVDPAAKDLFYFAASEKTEDGYGAEVWLEWQTMPVEGKFDFLLKCETESGYKDEIPFTMDIVPLPEDMPMEFTPNTLHYEVELGERIQIDLGYELGGVIPDGVPNGLDYSHLYDALDVNGNFVEENEDGLFVTFNKEYRYTFRLFWDCANYTIASEPITLIVGDGVPEDAGIGLNIPTDMVFAGQGDGWFAEAWLDNYTLFAGETIEWELKCLSEEETGKVYIAYMDDDNGTATLHSASYDDRFGDNDYLLIARTSAGDVFEASFPMHVTGLPEEMPTELISADTITVQPGEYFEFMASDYVTPDVAPPAWLNSRYQVSVDEALRSNDWFMWVPGVLDHGFAAQLDEPARYTITVQLCTSNYVISKDIIIVVGDGVSENAELALYQEIDRVYLECEEDRWLGYAELENYPLADNEEIDWQLERIDGSDTAAAEVYLESYGQGCNIRFNNMTGEGTAIYRLTANAPGLSKSCEITLHVDSLPDGLPTVLNQQKRYEFEVADRWEFLLSEVQFGNGTVPENANVRTAVPALTEYPIWQENECEWLDDGFAVTFTRDGRYTFCVDRMIGNYSVPKMIEVVVGSGVSGNIETEWPQVLHVAYVGQEEDRLVGYGHIINYTVFEDENIWTLERLDDQCTSSAVIYPEFFGEFCDLRLRDVNETGRVVYNLKLETETGYTAEHEFVVDIEELPDNLPTALDIEQTEFTFTIGEEMELDIYDIGFADGVVPENADVRPTVPVITDLPIWREHEAELRDGKVWFRFCTPGEYEFDVCVSIGNYALYETISVTVQAPQPFVEPYLRAKTLFVDLEEDREDHYIGNLCLQNYELQEGEAVEWSMEPVGLNEGEAPIVDMELSDQSEDTYNINLHYNEIRSTGTGRWNVIATVGEKSWVYELTMEVQDRFWNLPDGIFAYEDMNVPVNGAVMLRYDAIEIFGEWSPEGLEPELEFWFDHDQINAAGSVEYRDNGVKLVFTGNGTYEVTAAAIYGNYVLRQDFKIRVGSGIGSNVEMQWYDAATHMYLNQEDDMWVGDAYIANFPAQPGDIYWDLRPAGDPSEYALELHLGGDWDVGCGMNVFARRISDEPGYADYVLYCYIGDMLFDSKGISVTLGDMPENLPQNLDVGETIYHLNVGDEFVFTNEMIRFGAGEIPEGAYTDHWDIWEAEMMAVKNPTFERFDENGVGGFRVTFEQPGRYRFIAVRRINNYLLQQEIGIIVGEDDLSSARLGGDFSAPLLVAGYGDTNIGWWAVQDFVLLESDEIEWNLERVMDENSPEEPLFELFIDGYWDRQDGLNIHSRNVTEESVGTETYRLTCKINGVEIGSEDITVTVIEDPGDLPKRIGGLDTEHFINCEEGLTFIYEDWYFADGNMPADVPVYYGAHEAEFLPNYWPMEQDRGFSVFFPNDGTYRFVATMRFGNYMIERPVWIVVGRGFSDQVNVDWHTDNNVWYAAEGNTHCFSGGYLHEYELAPSDSIYWDVDMLEGHELANVFISEDALYDEGRGVNLMVTDFSGQTGTLRYRLNVWTAFGFNDSREYTVEVVELPDELPEVQVDIDEITLDCRQEYTFCLDQITLSGNVPEDAQFHTYVDIFDAETRWSEDGNEVTFFYHEPGRYYIRACANINNYQLGKIIPVTVGEGGLRWNPGMTEAYATAGDYAWAGDVNLYHGFHRIDGEEIRWTLNEIYRDQGVTATLDVNGIYEDQMGAVYDWNNIGDTVGRVVYRANVSSNYGYDRSWEISLDVVPLSADLPTGLSMPTNTLIPTNEWHEFYFDWVEFDGGNVPEGALVQKHVVPDYDVSQFGEAEDMHDENGKYLGKKVLFYTEGVYKLTVIGQINNMRVYNEYTIEVKD